MDGYSLGLYEKSMPGTLTMAEKLRTASDAGFDFLEISIDETEGKLSRLQWSNEQKYELLKAERETGTPILTMCLSGHRKYPIGSADPVIRARGMEIMSDAIGFACQTGIRIIQIAGYDEYYNPSTPMTRELFAQNLKACTLMAARKGVVLAFETMETPFMNTVGKAMEHIRAVGSPYLQVYPDLGNITNSAEQYGHTVVSDILAGQGHLVGMHLKETVTGKFREIEYGTGHVDFESGISAAMACGVRLFVGEFWYMGNNDWQETLKASHEFLSTHLKKCIEKGI
ncbi:MAG: L-ribulose-5-phosphate 3-epimerase [Saccharofermentanales bacterium]